MHSLLVIDDDNVLTRMLTEYFPSDHYLLSVAGTAREGLALMARKKFDLVILDVMLPEMNGFDCLQEIRKNYQSPVIMLTAQGSEVDRIIGLEMGADDYLSKPFNPRELMARINAVLRRIPAEKTDNHYEQLTVGSLVMNTSTYDVYLAGVPVRLTSAEARVLEVLMRMAGSVVTRQHLMEKALMRKLTLHDRSIDTHVSSLRRKLQLDQQGGRPGIRSFRSHGYMLLAG